MGTELTWRRAKARRFSLSEAGGTTGRTRVSEQAWSLKGMPTTSLAPSFLYICSGCSRSCTWPQKVIHYRGKAAR